MFQVYVFVLDQVLENTIKRNHQNYHGNTRIRRWSTELDTIKKNYKEDERRSRTFLEDIELNSIIKEVALRTSFFSFLVFLFKS